MSKLDDLLRFFHCNHAKSIFHIAREMFPWCLHFGKRASLGLALSVALGLGGEAGAAKIEWNKPTGNWSLGSNWDTGQVPGSGDYAYIDNNGTSTLDANGSVYYLRVGDTLSGKLVIQGGKTLTSVDTGNGIIIGFESTATGTVEVDGAGSLLKGNAGITLGSSGTGYLTLSNSGTTTSYSHIVIGEKDGSNGTVTIQSGGLLQNTRVQAGTPDNHAKIFIGSSGKGTVDISGAGRAISQGDIYLGYDVGGNGVVSITGTDSLLKSNLGVIAVGRFGSGDLTVKAGGQAVSQTEFTIGGGDATHKGVGTVLVDGTNSLISSATSGLNVGSYGTGTLTLSNGGKATAKGDIIIGDYTGSIGTVDVGAGSSMTNTTSTAGVLRVGNRTGSMGTVTIHDGGSVVSKGRILIGSQDGSNGMVTVNGAGSSFTNESGNLDVGLLGKGTLTLINGGNATANANINIGLSYNANGTGLGTVTIWTGSTLTSTLATGDLTVGADGKGILDLKGGKAIAQRHIYIGNSSTGEGTVTVETGSTLENVASGGTLAVGQGGKGTLNLTGGNVTSRSHIYIGNKADSDGTVNVGAGSTLQTLANHIYVGNEGEGNLFVDDGGTVIAKVSIFTGTVKDSVGTVRVDGASTMKAPSTVEIGGAGTGYLYVTEGSTVTSGDYIYIGRYAGSKGYAYVDGSTLKIDGTEWSSPARTLNVGQYGEGYLKISNGGTVTSGTAIYIGGTSGVPGTGVAHSGDGTVLVTGAGSLLQNPSDNLVIGSFAKGKLNIENGANVISAVNIHIGGGGPTSQDTSIGIVTVTGNGSLLQNLSTNNSVNINVGHYGDGTLNVSDGGSVVTSSGGIIIASATGSKGTVNVDGGSIRVNNADTGGIYGIISVGNSGTGELNIENGGTVISSGRIFIGGNGAGVANVSGGSLLQNKANYLIVGRNAGSQGELNLSGASKAISNVHIDIGQGGTGDVTVTEGSLLQSEIGFIYVGHNNTGTLRIESASTATAQYGITIGMDEGVSGDVWVEGTGSLLQVTNTPAGSGANDGRLRVGSKGTGTLTLIDGAKADIQNSIIVGDTSTGTGTVDIGAGSVMENKVGGIYVGNSGEGTLNITDGGRATAANEIFIGYYGGSHGIVTVDGESGTGVASLLENKAGVFSVGRNGVGEVTLTNGGNATSVGDIRLGHLDSGASGRGNGTVTVGTGSTLKNTAAASMLYVGDGGDGMLKIEGGDVVSQSYIYIGNDTKGIGTVNVSDGGSLENKSNILYVGFKGKGYLNLSEGGTVTSASGVIIANTAGSTGDVTVDGAGSLLYNKASTFTVGYAGIGTLELTNGGGATSYGSIYIGRDGNATTRGVGTVTVGKDSVLQNLETGTSGAILYVGNNGTGTLNLEDGGKAISQSHIYVGFGSTGKGFVTITGAGSSLTNVASNATLVVGNNGTGEMEISAGGSAISAGGVSIGSAAGASGTVNISGVDGLGNASLLQNSGATASMNIGQYGKGYLDISNGGKAYSANTIAIGFDANAYGKVTVDGEGSMIESKGWFRIGNQAEGELYLTNGGKIKSGGDIQISFSGSGKGLVSIDGTDSEMTGTANLNVGNSYTGTLKLTAGGKATVTGAIGIGQTNTTSVGVVTIDGEGSKLETTGGAGTTEGTMTVGAAGKGTLSITNGGKAVTAKAITIGNTANTGNGTVTVDGSGSEMINKSGTLTVANDGTGFLEIINSGHVSSYGDVYITNTTKGNGKVHVGASSLMESTNGNIYIGHHTTTTTALLWGTGTLKSQNGLGLVRLNGKSTISAGDYDGDLNSLNIIGNFQSDSGATFTVDLLSGSKTPYIPDQADRIVVSGTANVTNPTINLTSLVNINYAVVLESKALTWDTNYKFLLNGQEVTTGNGRVTKYNTILKRDGQNLVLTVVSGIGNKKLTWILPYDNGSGATNGDGAWSIDAGNKNWYESEDVPAKTPIWFIDGDSVTFGQFIAGEEGTVTIEGTGKTVSEMFVVHGTWTINGNILADAASSENLYDVDGKLKVQGGSVTLNGQNSFLGGIELSGTGKIILGNALSLGVWPNVANSDAGIVNVLGEGTIATLVDRTLSNLLIVDNIAGLLHLEVADGKTLTLAGPDVAHQQTLLGGGNATLSKIGTGTLRLTNDNTAFTGYIQHKEGTIRVATRENLFGTMGNYSFTQPVNNVSGMATQAEIRAAQADGSLPTLQVEAGKSITLDGEDTTNQGVKVADGSAGSIDLETGATLTFTNSTATNGGAISIGNNGFLALTPGTNAQFIFADNTATQNGGAIYNAGTLYMAVNSENAFQFSGNSDSNGANAIYMASGSTLLIDNQSVLDMRDPIKGTAATGATNRILHSGTGTWKLGGDNVIASTGGNTQFLVGGGQLYLYRDGEVANGSDTVDTGKITLGGTGSSFTLADGARLQLSGAGHEITTGGTITFEENSTVGFDIRQGQPLDTRLILDAGTYNVNNAMTIDILAFGATDYIGPYNLIQADGISKSGKTLTIAGVEASSTRAAGSAVLLVTTDDDGNDILQLMGATTGIVTWTNKGATGVWNQADKNWDTTLILGFETDDRFLSGDSVVFDASRSTTRNIVIESTGVGLGVHQWANGEINPGMVINGGDWTFSGGAINGGTIRFMGSGSFAFDTRSMNQRVTVDTGVTGTIKASNGATLTFTGLGGVDAFGNPTDNGGAIHGDDGSTVVIGDAGSTGKVVFNANKGVDGGAIYGDNVTVSGGTTVFTDNHADGLGGAVYAKGNATFVAADADLVFKGNTQGAGSDPNAIYMENDGDDNTLSLAANAGRRVLLYDPVESSDANPNLTVNINENAANTGTVVFDTYQSNVHGDTTVHNGTMTLANDATYGADDNVGSFTLAGSAAAAKNAVLMGNGTVSAATSYLDGTIRPGDTPKTFGTLTFNGDVVMSDTTHYEVDVMPGDNSQHDLIVVNGEATLGGLVHHVGLDETASSEYDPRGKWLILTATDGYGDSRFSGVVTDYTFLKVSLLYEMNDVFLKLTWDGTFIIDDLTPNERETAKGLGCLENSDNPLFNDIMKLTDADNYPDILDHLSGEIHATLTGVIMDTDRRLARMLRQRLWQNTPCDGTIPLWFSMDGDYTTFEGDYNAAGGRNYGYGANLGAEKCNDLWRIGAAFRYADNTLKVPVRDSWAEYTSYTLGLYGHRRFDRVLLSFGGTYGLHDINTTRNTIGLSKNQQLHGDYRATSGQFFAELAYLAVQKEDEDAAPYFSVGWCGVHTDQFAETGGYAGLLARERDNNSFSTALGFRWRKSYVAWLAIETDVYWQHIYGTIDPKAVFRFNGGCPFKILGAELSHDAMGLDLDACVRLTDRSLLRVGYSGFFGTRTFTNGANASMEVRF